MLSFNLYAGTNIGLRENNEDNFIVCPDLLKNSWMVPANHKRAIQLGRNGCVMIVADGMGGQNAGEVASAIAIDTIKVMFSNHNLTNTAIESPGTIKSFLRKAIIEADNQIKKRAETDCSTQGMGSTIVIAWLINNRIYIAWLGDSRAYSYIPQKGIGRISKDHSYVQQLVDANILTDDEAMNDPHSNIITRSLGDLTQKAKPDVIDYPVENGEIIILCSDGLCGVCRDETIGNIIADNYNDLQVCKDALTNAALAAGGSDNITIALLKIFTDNSSIKSSNTRIKNKFNISSNIMYLITIMAVTALGVIAYILTRSQPMTPPDSSGSESIPDSIPPEHLKEQQDTSTVPPNLGSSGIVKKNKGVFDSAKIYADTISREDTIPREVSNKFESFDTTIITPATGKGTVTIVN